MKIAIIGSRGIPAKYGGFETFADGLATRLVKKDYKITVSCEYEPPESQIPNYNGIDLKYFPIKPPKNYFLRMFYENLSDIYFLFKLTRSHDIVYFLGIEVGMFLFIPKLLKRQMHLMVNIDGVMWKRTKFNWLARFLLKLNHYFATVFADIIITDAEEMKNYVPERYKDKSVYISYGISEVEKISWNEEKLKELKNYSKIKGILPEKYWLVVARLEPENNIHVIVDAFSKADTEFPLIVIGDYTSDKYKKQIENIAKNSNNIIFLGSIYDLEILDMFRQNCFSYIHGHTVGGTNPSLLEAMIMKNIIIAHDNGFNREVCGESALYFRDDKDLNNKIRIVEDESINYFKLEDMAYNKVKEGYLWDKIENDYELLFENILKKELSKGIDKDIDERIPAKKEISK